MLKNILKKVASSYYDLLSKVAPKNKYSVPKRNNLSLVKTVSSVGDLIIKNPLTLVIFFTALYLCIQNYEPGTWLMGWDTLHPEFNFPLNISRAIFGVFREDQGLGTLASHAHMSDLPRMVFLYLSSLVLPVSFLRYFYIFLCLIIGPLGIYAILNGSNRKIGAFLGGMFYLLNLGTLQHFYVPFEMFNTEYAFLPWLFYFLINYLKNSSKRNLGSFVLVTLLATPMAYAPTLWYVYFGALVLFCLAWIVLYPEKLKSLRKIVILLVTTLIINSFWLLPNLYQITSVPNFVAEAKINEMFSWKAYAEDSKFATLENAPILKGFLFDWREYKDGSFVDLMGEWKNHLDNLWVLAIGWLLFAVSVYGFILSLVRREKSLILFVPLVVLSAIFLLHSQEPFNSLVTFLRDTSSMFKEGYRFPWTKFSIIAIMCMSIYFGRGIEGIARLINKRIWGVALSLVTIFLLVIWMLPAFQGNLISPTKRVNFPSEYQELYNWFSKEPTNGRIALLPMPDYWGWEYRNWGFEGAGFIWFGLPQPVLTRDSDRWNPKNEDFYWEAAGAYSTNNPELYKKVLEKYDVTWLVIDESTVNPSWPRTVDTQKLESFLIKMPEVSLAFSSGQLKVYKIQTNIPESTTFLTNNLASVGPTYQWNDFDSAFDQEGNYSSQLNAQIPDVYYPFRSLFTGKSIPDHQFTIEENENSLIFHTVLPKGIEGYQVNITNSPDEILMQVDPNDLSQVQYLSKTINLNGQSLNVTVPKIKGLYGFEINAVDSDAFKNVKNCNPDARGSVINQIISVENNKYLRLIANNANNCSATYSLPSLPHNLGYLITVENRNKKGQSLLFWIENLSARKSEQEVYLPYNLDFTKSYFIQPPTESDGLGYQLHFDGNSIGLDNSINDLGKISVNPIPYSLLTEISLRKTIEANKTQFTSVASNHANTSVYTVNLPQDAKYNTLVLSQTYYSGWKAYVSSNSLFPFFDQELKEHILVNNWENGWVLPDDIQGKQIVLVFWPQYLEYLGFFLTLGYIGTVALWRTKQ